MKLVTTKYQYKVGSQILNSLENLNEYINDNDYTLSSFKSLDLSQIHIHYIDFGRGFIGFYTNVSARKFLKFIKKRGVYRVKIDNEIYHYGEILNILKDYK